ncbi:MAG: hypothetical protein WAW39_15615 [Prosthecobacter sp.]|uniref:hypothetical protein n=1 Tax=Prosthecobacter sp. TaxID=1965333 RepID=UPI003BB21A90
MPASFNGIGTAYYGECDFRADGSYVTTEWITVFFVPLLPFRSVRLIRVPSQDVNLIVFISEGFAVIERGPLHWGQVGRVYGFALLLVAHVLACFEVPQLIGLTWGMVAKPWWIFVCILLLALPFFLPLYLRHKARRKVPYCGAALLETINRLKSPQTAV